MRRMSLEPASTLEKTSRPRRSVPKKCCVDGAAPISGVWSKRGSYGVMWAAEDRARDPEEDDRRADDERRAPDEQAYPLAPGDARLRAAGRAPSSSSFGRLEADAWVQERGDDVRDEGDDHVRESDDQHAGREHGVVLQFGGLEGGQPDTAVVEEQLDRDEPAEEIPDLRCDDRDRGEQIAFRSTWRLMTVLRGSPLRYAVRV